MSKPSTTVYWAGLQDEETSAVLDCGCVLHTDGSTVEPDACDVAFFACPTHDHAQELRDEVEGLLTWFEQTKDANNLARIHSSGLGRLREIVAKMRGQQA